MNRITSLGGFLALIYIWYQYKEWTITVNETNVVSPYLIKIVHTIPNFIISTSIVLMLIFLLLSFLFNIRIFLINTFSRLLLFVIFMIGLNMLMLEETTTLYLFKIYHPVAVQYKLQYFDSLFLEILESQKSPLMYKQNTFLDLAPVQEVIQNIKHMNVTEIHKATVNCIKKLHQVPVLEEPQEKRSLLVTIIFLLLAPLYSYFVKSN